MTSYNLRFEKTIESWDEAVPLGNGDIGCLIWGKPSALRFSLDKNDLWDCSGAPQAKGGFTYAAMKEFVREGDQKSILETFDKPYDKSAPTKLPAGKIIVDLKTDENVVSSLNLKTAEASLEIGGTLLKSFVSAAEPFGYLLIDSEISGFSIENPEFGLAGEPDVSTNHNALKQSLKNLHYPPAEKHSYTESGVSFSYFTQKISEELTYGIFLAVKKEKGTALAVYTAALGGDKEKLISGSLGSLTERTGSGYARAFEKHRAWWEDFWGKSHITLENKFFETNWVLGNYFLGSCSRKGRFPIPLQGVWTADNGELPPWKGDYHHDLNTELTYYSYLKANHLPEGECFIDYLLSLTDKARRFAREFFGAPGLCLPSVTDLEGNALGGWAMYSLSPVNQAWLCRVFEKHFDYTLDMKFLKEKAYPYLSESAECILALTSEDKNGKLVLPLSSSPEIHDNTLKAWLTPNSTYDLSLMRSLLLSLIRFSGILGYTGDNARWQDIFDKLDELPINKKGVYMLSRDESLKESHRHFAHLMAIHPLRLIKYDTSENRRIIDACIKDLEKLGTRLFCGYSFAWLAELYCIRKNGKKAAETLEAFWKYFCLPNGFHCNGDYLKKGYSAFDYRPFTLEGNFCAVDALQEMLLYSDGETIEICPAVPESWKTLSFSLLAEGGIKVTAEMRDGEIIGLTLCASLPVTRSVRVRGKSYDAALSADTELVLI